MLALLVAACAASDTLSLVRLPMSHQRVVALTCVDGDPLAVISTGLGEPESVVSVLSGLEATLPIVGATQTLATGTGRFAVFAASARLVIHCRSKPLSCERTDITALPGPFVPSLDTVAGGWIGAPLDNPSSLVRFDHRGKTWTGMGQQPRVARDPVSNARMLHSYVVVLGRSALIFRRYAGAIERMDLMTGEQATLRAPDDFLPVARTWQRTRTPGFALLPETRIAYTASFALDTFALALYSGRVRGTSPREAGNARHLREFAPDGRMLREWFLSAPVRTGAVCTDGRMYLAGEEHGASVLYWVDLPRRRLS